MIERRSVRGVVLAGGDSTRFDGGDKALAPLDGRPLLDHVVDAVAAGTTGSPLLAVASPEDGDRLGDAVEAPVEPVLDPDAHAGPLAGIFAAVDVAEDRWLFVCGCDMPLVTAPVIDSLRQAGDPEAGAVVPTVDGHEQPLHAVYRRDAVANVRDTVASRGGPMALLDALPRVHRVRADRLDGSLAAAVTNVNTREGLRRLRDRTDSS